MGMNRWSIARFWNVDVLTERKAVRETIVATGEDRLPGQVSVPNCVFLPVERP